MLSKLFKNVILIVILSISKVQADTIKIANSNFVASSRLGKIELFHDDDDGFFIVKDGIRHEVQNYFVDKEIRNISNEKLGYILGTIRDVMIGGQKCTFTRISFEEFQNLIRDDQVVDNHVTIELDKEVSSEIISQITSGAYLVVKQMNDGEYTIHLMDRLLGGGVCGLIVGACAGKFITYFVCHGTILIIGACTGPAAPVTIVALEVTFLPTIEAASTVVALACGIIGGVITGLV